MKTFRTVFLLGLVLFFTGNAWALPVAGEWITMQAPGTDGGYYQMTAEDGKVYQSFCLERSEYFSSGGSYYVESISNEATGAYGSDPLDIETQWLFAAYREGILDDRLGVEVTSRQIQNAIWFLEEEWQTETQRILFRSNWYNFRGLYNSYNDEMIEDLLSHWDIEVVNIITPGVSYNQSQLVGAPAPVPEPATMLLLGTGLISLAGIGRRRFFK